ncbi:MAG: type II 3-dehydroquinate dehydratase [Deltaproteobacteria bacterium]|nr:MAG: type II 3-dehydroquinate dehydratase [Deltaproteobacteria bacterium]
MRFLVLQGPNLNLLGTREPSVYGATTLAEVEARLDALAGELGVEIEHFQSNHEGDLIDRVHEAREEAVTAAIVNAGGLTHSSVSLRDALVGCELPFVEVHISNVHARESFRQRNLLADVAIGSIVGLGVDGYELALRALVRRFG